MPPNLAMPSFTGAVIAANLLFGSIGFVAFIYGKRMHFWKPMLIGLTLMAYTYFVENTILLFGIGTVLTISLFLWRD
jgi:hypothetical protein